MKKLCIQIFLLCYCLSLSMAAGARDLQAEYRDAYLTSVAAASCLGVYTPYDSTEFSYMRYHGWEVIPYTQKEEGIKAHYSVAKNSCPESRQVVYMVTIKGSSTKGDWKVNFKTDQVNFGGQDINAMEELAKQPKVKQGPTVHRGFNAYTDVILHSSVVDEESRLQGLYRLVQEDPDTYLLLTGHSLGGAVATLLGQRLISLGLPPEKLMVITFGAPAIGNDVFAQQYGERMRLLRVTNTADPVPGSLQTFFGGYKQFGRNIKYSISTKINDMQHDISLYTDYSISRYYALYDEAVAAGLDEYLPYRRDTQGVPLVALWIQSSPEIAAKDYVPNVKRLISDEYKLLLPSYVVVDNNLDMGNYSHGDILRASKEAGADYVLIVGIDGHQLRQDTQWYIALDQGLFTIEGDMLSMGRFATKVLPAVGTINATGQLFLDAKNVLAEKLPFPLETSKLSLPNWRGGQS